MNKQAISKIVGTALICLIVASVTGSIGESRASATGQLVVHFIDVGQGDAILIDYGSYEMLIDGGQWGDCAGYIPRYVDGALEVVVATHPHADHIGGLTNVLNAFVVEDIWLNGDNATTQTYADFMDKVNAEGAQVHQAQREEQISLSTLTFDVLHPMLPLGSDTNENSIVLKLSFGQVGFLFTGDACAGAEASMLSAGIIEDIEILKVGHHGSKYSSTPDFLVAAQPEIAVYSAGAGNPYGHPAPETIARLQDVGASIYGTDVYGTIIVTTDGTTYSVHPAGDDPPTASFDLELKAGWNLVSLPVDPGITDPNIILKDVGWYSIYAWDAAGKRYVKPGAEGMVVGKGYWVMVLNNVTQSITGAPVQSFTFDAPAAGWYLIGSLYSRATFIANPLQNAYTKVYEWDAINKMYTAPLTTIAPGMGNWFLALGPCSVTASPYSP